MKQMVLVVSCDGLVNDEPCPNPLDENHSHTTTFTWGGIAYELDLCDDHMAPWVTFMDNAAAKATPLGRVKPTPAPAAHRPAPVDGNGHRRKGKSPANPVQCPYCVYSYGLGAGLARHIKQQHPEHIDDPLPPVTIVTGGNP